MVQVIHGFSRWHANSVEREMLSWGEAEWAEFWEAAMELEGILNGEDNELYTRTSAGFS